MAITVYRKGTTHVENGIPCEIARIEHSSLNGYLSGGWKLTVEEIGTKPDSELANQRPIIAKPSSAEKTKSDQTVLKSLGTAFDRMRGKA